MKTLNIIVKTPGDGDPLDMVEEFATVQGGRMTTVGYKFEHADGKMYGDYIMIPKNLNREQLENAIHFVIGMAFSMEDELIREESGYYDDYEQDPADNADKAPFPD